MANLSNINNKFLFTDGDFLLINGATANSISATESGIAIKNSNAATLSLQNSAANGKNHTLWSNTDGSFNITDIGVATRFTIASGGNIGIGTNNPSSGKLVVEGDNYVITNSGKSLGGIDLRTNANPGAGLYTGGISFGGASTGRAAISGYQDGADGDRQGLVFFTHGSGTGSADAAEAMRVQSDGNVGIGVQDPEKKLEVKSDTTYDGIMLDVLSAPEITFRDRGNSDTRVGTGRHALDGFHIDTYSGNAFFIKGSNRYVGIGVTSPAAQLTIGNPGGNTTRSIQIEGNNSASGMNGVIGYFSNGLYISNNYYYNSGQVHPVSTYGQTNIACITGTTTGSNFIDLSVSDHTDSNNAPDVRMRIMDSGNVGIGAQSTGTLQNILQVSSGVDGDGIILTGIGDNTGIANGSYRKIGFRYDDTDESFESEIRFVVTNSGAHGGQMEFFTDNTSGVKTRAITIDNAQRVGIGTTSANAKLQIGSTQNVNATGISLCAGASVGNLIARTTTHHNWFPYSDGSNYYSADNHIFRNAGHGTEWMRIASNGAIGIGGANYGTAGQVLTSNGNAAPSWQAAGGSAWPQEKFAEYTIDSTTSNILVATMNSTTWHGNYLAGCLKFTMSTSDYVQVTYVPVSTFLSGSNKWFFKGTEMTSKNNGSNPAVLVFTFAGDQGTFGSTCTLKINRNQNVSNYTKVNVLVQAISNPNMFILN